MRFTRVILLYFVLGAVMFGGGAIDFADAGVSGFFVEHDSGSFAATDQTSQNLEGLGGAISQLVGEFIGGVQLVYNLAVGLLGFLNWPIVVLSGVGAPPMAVLLIGGTFSAAFYLSIITLMRSSA
jgi:hypothetical protein